MSWRCSIACLATVMLIPPHGAALAKDSDSVAQPLEIRLTARFLMPQEWMRSLVRVEPHTDNRLLRVTIDSSNYFRSSDVQLNGASAARSHFFVWKSLPPGAYEVTAIVLGTDGRRSERRATFEVLGTSTYPAESSGSIASD